MSPVYIVWLYNDDHRCVWHLIENKLSACALAPNPIKGDGGGDGDDGSSTQSATPLLPNDVVFEIYANADMKASENTEGRRSAATTRSKKEKHRGERERGKKPIKEMQLYTTDRRGREL